MSPTLPHVRTRLSDLAAQAGVSTATVSRVLNGKPGVASETRQAVLAALDVLGSGRPSALRARAGAGRPRAPPAPAAGGGRRPPPGSGPPERTVRRARADGVGRV